MSETTSTSQREDGSAENVIALVGQDWGGLVGLRLVAEHPDRFRRVVAAMRRQLTRHAAA